MIAWQYYQGFIIFFVIQALAKIYMPTSIYFDALYKLLQPQTNILMQTVQTPA